MFKVEELVLVTKGRLISKIKEVKLKGISIDSRTIKRGEVFIAIKGNNFDGHNYIEEAIKKGSGCIIAERLKAKGQGLRTAFIEVEDTTKALGEIAKLHRNKFNIPVIAVTGSAGKTTAKEMISCVLSKKFKVLKNEGTKNNHIGLPMTLLRLDKSYDFAVLEAGTNHPGEIEYLSKICQPNIAVITNIGSSHLEFFGDLKGVCDEKITMFKYLNSPGIAMVNADDDLLKGKLLTQNKAFFGFGIERNADFAASEIKRLNGKIEFLVNKKYKFFLKTLGACNVYNALIAIGIGRFFGLSYKDIAERLSRFSFPQNRLNLIELNKIKFINDTYNSNPLSLRQALDALGAFRVKGRKIFVMGDMLELGEQGESLHYLVGENVTQICDAFVAVGRLSKVTAEGAKNSGFKKENIFTCENSAQAKEVLFKEISPGPEDIVLVKGSRSMKMEDVLKS